jgi:succinate dehydrogenase / fumarate reductase iron-sulfur subunit
LPSRLVRWWISRAQPGSLQIVTEVRATGSIECFLCQDVCHVIRDHEVHKADYAGPRLFVRYMELESHPLDTGDRRHLVRHEMGLGLCNITKCCTEVCPEHIKITDNAIIPLKERVVDATYDPFAWLGRRIRRRPKATDPTRSFLQPPTGTSPQPDDDPRNPSWPNPTPR